MTYGTINVDKVVSSDGVTAGGLYGFKNRIINGAMVIDQRNAGAAVSTDGAFALDRWQIDINAFDQLVFSAQQDTTAPTGFVNSLKVTISTPETTVDADEFMTIRQLIEGLNFSDMSWGSANAKAVTLSFWVRSSVTGTFAGTLNNSGKTRNYPFTYVINSADTWEQKTITVSGDTSGTWLTTNGIGCYVQFSLAAGSTYAGTAGSWSATRYEGATGQTNLVTTNGATFYVTGVQLEKGSTATSFDFRDYGRELALCQRYCYVMGRADIYNPIGYGFAASATAANVSITLPVPMRTTPSSITVSGNWQVSDGVAATAATSVVFVSNQNSPNLVAIQGNTASGLTQYRPVRIEAANSSSAYIIIPAEL